MWAFPALAVLAGAAITFQASMNARLGVLLKNPVLATAIAFLFACFFTLLFMLINQRQLPVYADIRSIPTYLWFGGILSAFGVGSYYYLIPKMGVGSMMSFALSGQLILAIIAGHFGWFEQPIKPITPKVLIGIFAMVLGINLINGGSRNVY
jgi:transporter family-2 protein